MCCFLCTILLLILEITFKNNIASNVTMTYSFDDTNTAASYGQLMQFSYSQSNTTNTSVTQSGNNVIVSGKASDIMGSDQNLMRDELTNNLQNAGFTVK